VLTEREATRMNRPIDQVSVLKVVLRAARRATGKAISTVATVPRVAMWMVSMRASRTASNSLQSGGYIRNMRSPIWMWASSR
jgi:hypothetical protein